MPHNKLMVPVGPNVQVGPDQFGPSLWQGLHYITLGYPVHPTEEQKQKYKMFFLLLQDTLPCSVCKKHYKENLAKMPITNTVLETKENFVKWLIDFHNVVNVMKGKPTIEYDKARKMINTDIMCNMKTTEKFENTETNFVYWLIGIFAILISIAILYKKK